MVPEPAVSGPVPVSVAAAASVPAVLTGTATAAEPSDAVFLRDLKGGVRGRTADAAEGPVDVA